MYCKINGTKNNYLSLTGEDVEDFLWYAINYQSKMSSYDLYLDMNVSDADLKLLKLKSVNKIVKYEVCVTKAALWCIDMNKVSINDLYRLLNECCKGNDAYVYVLNEINKR